ncbi:hypothetical protein MBLNU230_g5118t1 [Neophaeotheca triangularis]
MAAEVASAAPAMANGQAIGSGRDGENFHEVVLRLRNDILAGSHPTLSLPQAKIDELKRPLVDPESVQQNGAHEAAPQEQQNGNVEAFAHNMSSIQKDTAPHALMPAAPEKTATQQGQPKRKRIEREMSIRAGQRKRARSVQDPHLLPATVLEEHLDNAWALVSPISGLKSRVTQGNDAGSSFDENDYYSSLVESDWTPDSEVKSNKAADRSAGPSASFTADYEQLGITRDKAPVASSPLAEPFTFKGQQQPSVQSANAPQLYGSRVSATQPFHSFGEAHEEVAEKSEDDEYTPPPAAAFDSYRGKAVTKRRQATAASNDDSEYEPGEITAGSVMATPQDAAEQPEETSPGVPIVRNNHLTNIAAPQPNRVSPLAASQHFNDDYELALVNGRPEVVLKKGKKTKQPQPQPQPTKKSKRFQHPSAADMRISSPSPPPTAENAKAGKKTKNKKGNKKRKQEQDNPESGKRRRQNTPPGSAQQDSYIKPEPTSPMFENVPQALTYGERPEQQMPAQVDLVSPRQAAPMAPVYQHGPPAPYGYDSASSSRYASPAPVRYVQRDNQDLRRVASMQYAQHRPASPPQDRRYSPVGPYLAASGYGNDDPTARSVRPREDARASPATMAPQRSAMPPPPPEQPASAYGEPSPRFIVDHHGMKYYAAPAPPPERPEVGYERAPSRMTSFVPMPPSDHYDSAAAPRASMAPPNRHAMPEPAYARAPSRAMSVYDQPTQYAPAEQRMGPPPPPVRRAQPVEYVDAQGYRVDPQGYRVREYSTRPSETMAASVPPQRSHYVEPTAYRYSPGPTSPAHQYTQREPASQPQHEATSPVYAPPRSYSIVPDHAQQPAQAVYAPRQASVAPVQYALRREMAPPPAQPPQDSRRAVSVMPAEPAPPYGYAQHAPAPRSQYAAPVQSREYAYSQAPPEGYQYVDQYGRVVQYQ